MSFKVFSKDGFCLNCIKVKRTLEHKGYSFDEQVVSTPELKEELRNKGIMAYPLVQLTDEDGHVKEFAGENAVNMIYSLDNITV